MANIDEMFADLAAADAAGDKELATVIASRIRQAESAAAQPAPAPIPEAAPQSRLQSFLSAASRTYTPELGITSPELAAAERQGMVKIAPEVVRYGVPIGVGIATAPVSAPASALAMLGGMATTAGISAGASALSEAGAQALEMMSGKRQELSGTDIAAATAYGATPFVPAGRVGLMARAAINPTLAAGTAIATQKYIEGKEADGWILPAALSLGGTLGSDIGNALNVIGKARETLSKGRFGGGVALQELVPELAFLENTAYQQGVASARKTIDTLGANFADEVDKVFAGVPGMSDEARRQLAPQVGRIQGLKKAYDASLVELNDANNKLRVAEANNSSALPELRQKAKEAGIIAARDEIVVKQAADEFFGSGLSRSLQDVSNGVQQQALGKLDTLIKESRKVGLGKLYDEAGIGLNDPIIDLPTVLSFVETKAKEKGSLLAGDIERDRVITLIKEAFKTTAEKEGSLPPILDRYGKQLVLPEVRANKVLTREGLMNLADDISTELTKKGYDAKRSGKVAAEIYDIVKSASNDYIGRNKPAGISEAYKKANEAAAGLFSSRASDLAQDIINKRPASIVDRLITEGGKGTLVDELNGYANSILALGPEYQPVANEFRKNISEVVRAGILEKAAIRGTGLELPREVFDLKKVIETAQDLADTGFPIESLGFGSKAQLKDLAKVASALDKGVKMDEIGELIRTSSTVGANRALAMYKFKQAAKKVYHNLGFRERIQNEKELQKLAKDAKLSFEQANAELAIAQRDPIAQLYNNNELKLNPNPANNSEFVYAVMNLSNDSVSKLMNALDGRPGTTLANDFRLSAKAEVMKNILTTGGSEVDAVKLRDIFYGKTEDAKRMSENFKRIIGQQEYDNLKKNFVDPMLSAFEVQRFAREKGQAPAAEILTGFFAAKGIVEQRATSGFIKAMAFLRTFKATQSAAYFMANKMFVDPVTAPKFAAIGYSMDKAMSQPMLANTIKVANSLRAKEEAEQMQPTP